MGGYPGLFKSAQCDLPQGFLKEGGKRVRIREGDSITETDQRVKKRFEDTTQLALKELKEGAMSQRM